MPSRVRLLSFFLVLTFVLTDTSTVKAQGRERSNFDAGWRFSLGELPEFAPLKSVTITQWRWQDAGKTKPADEKNAQPSVKTDGSDWKDATDGQDVFNQQVGFAWFRTTLPDMLGTHRVMHFESVDDNGTIYLNGKKLLYHTGWNDIFDVTLDSAWKEKGHNELAVLVENTGGPGNIKGAFLQSLPPEVITPKPAHTAFDDSGWRQLHLPHDFVVEGTFDSKGDGSHGFLPKNVGWYRKTFDIPAADKGKSLWIDFDGVYRNSQVWLNGHLLGKHFSGYTSFRYDITQTANYGGKNILLVKADARSPEGWWYEGGGIYRHVWLNKADPLHVAPWGTYVTSTPDKEEDPAEAAIEIQTTLTNQSLQAESCKVLSEIQDSEGMTVLSLAVTQSVPKGGSQVVLQKARLPRPALWSLESPYLYKLVTKVEKDGQVVDSVTTPFGIRTTRFDKNKGFFLNGKSVKLKGTCNHQDFAGVGIAIPDRIFTYRLEKLKEMGSNAYRCSHNPPAAELLDECDRLGILVMDENRRLGDSEEVLSQLESMLIRDRNHPSVILWSICNEEGLQGSPEGQRIGEVMKKLILKFDKTRLVTCAMNGGWGSGLSNVVDLLGFNYHPNEYETYHASHPDTPLFGSETASTVCTRGIYENDKDKGYVSAYDANHPEWAQLAEVAWKAINVPYMAGCFVWTGFDYRGEPTPYWWPCINSHFGIIDMCGFPKDNFYYYQSWWSGKTVLHILPHWNWPDKKGKDIDVWVHSNCDKVELFLNGKTQGTQKMEPDGHLEWKVKYAPGTIKALGYKEDKVVLEDKVETTGAPAAIELRPYVAELKADGEDATPIAVEILDAKGRVVPLADNEVVFSVKGPAQIAGVANGDPSSHEPDKAEKRRAFNGHCLVVVQAGDNPGEITVTAEAKGLKPATITLRSQKVE